MSTTGAKTRGANLTPDHQRRAGSFPRVRLPTPKKTKPGESLEEATLRLQQAKATTEELDAEKRELELATLRGALIPAEDARDSLEAEHLRWVSELEQLPHSVVASLPPEVPSSLRDVIRTAVESQCVAVRKRIAAD